MVALTLKELTSSLFKANLTVIKTFKSILAAIRAKPLSMKYILFVSCLFFSVLSCKKESEIEPVNTEFRDDLIGEYKCELRHQETQFYPSGSIGYQNFYTETNINVTKGIRKVEIVIDHNQIGAVIIDSNVLNFQSYRLDVFFDLEKQSVNIKYIKNDTDSYVYQGVKVLD